MREYLTTQEVQDFLQWFLPLLLGLASSPLVTKLMSFWVSKQEANTQEIQNTKTLTDAANTTVSASNAAVEIMQTSMNRLEGEVKGLKDEIYKLNKKLEKESRLRVDCQKILKRLDIESKTPKKKSPPTRLKATK